MRGQGAEPIAIVGMACKFPGADDLDAFWQVLIEGRNTVTEGLPGSGGDRLGDLFGDPSARNEACRFGAFVDGMSSSTQPSSASPRWKPNSWTRSNA